MPARRRAALAGVVHQVREHEPDALHVGDELDLGCLAQRDLERGPGPLAAQLQRGAVALDQPVDARRLALERSPTLLQARVGEHVLDQAAQARGFLLERP